MSDNEDIIYEPDETGVLHPVKQVKQEVNCESMGHSKVTVKSMPKTYENQVIEVVDGFNYGLKLISRLISGL